MKRIKLKSGAMGWRGKLRENYENFEEFTSYAETYNLHGRLGFRSIAGAWRSNPVVEGGTTPSDFRRVKTK